MRPSELKEEEDPLKSVAKMEMSNVSVLVVMAAVLLSQVLMPYLRGPLAYMQPDLVTWLQDSDLEHLASAFVNEGKGLFVPVSFLLVCTLRFFHCFIFFLSFFLLSLFL